MFGPLKKCSLVFFFFGFFLILSHDLVCRLRQENKNSAQFFKLIFLSAHRVLIIWDFKKNMFFEIFSIWKKKNGHTERKRRKNFANLFFTCFYAFSINFEQIGPPSEKLEHFLCEDDFFKNRKNISEKNWTFGHHKPESRRRDCESTYL